MKTFKDLEFNTDDAPLFNRARINFENGYGVSVVYGRGAYGNKEKPYEVAVLYNNELTYSTHITNDVIGYCDEEKVTEIMKQIQELK